MRSYHGYALLAAAAFSSVCAHAAVIVQYTGEAAAASTIASGAASTNLALGDAANSLVDVNFNDAVNPYPSGVVYRFVPANVGTAVTTASAAVTNNRYYGFTLSATVGNELDLTSFTFLVGRGGAATPRGYDIRSSIDGYAATLGTADVAAQRPSQTAVTADLSGAAYQHLNSIQLRIYGYTPAAGQSIDVDSITVNGSVAAVPEPAMVSLGLGSLGLILRRRRRA